MNSDNLNVCPGFFECSLSTLRFILKDDYHKKRMNMLVYNPVEYNYLETLAKFFIIPVKNIILSRKKFWKLLQIVALPLQWIQTLHSLDRLLKIHSSISTSISGKLEYSRGGQPIVDYDAADNCRFYVSKIKAMSFQDNIPSIPIDNSKDHYVLLFDLTSMHAATEKCQYTELVGEPLGPELSFTFRLEHVTELMILGEWTSSVPVDKRAWIVQGNFSMHSNVVFVKHDMLLLRLSKQQA